MFTYFSELKEKQMSHLLRTNDLIRMFEEFSDALTTKFLAYKQSCYIISLLCEKNI